MSLNLSHVPTRVREALSHAASRVVYSKAVAKVATAAYARSMSMPLERAEHRCIPGVVVATEQVAPWLYRITVRGQGLRGYTTLGPDEYVGLVMPRPGQHLPDLSAVDGPNPRPALQGMPEDEQPDLRWYTVRGHRPELGELDIEIVLHPPEEVEEGPGASWVRTAAVGDEVAVQTGTASYVLARDARRELIAGDETAYPAMAGIIGAAADTDRELHVFLEVGGLDVLPPLPRPARGSMTTLQRGSRPPGEALAQAVRAADLPELGYAWVSGEQQLAKNVRRHLVEDRGLAKTAVYFCAYWILGRPRG